MCPGFSKPKLRQVLLFDQQPIDNLKLYVKSIKTTSIQSEPPITAYPSQKIAFQNKSNIFHPFKGDDGGKSISTRTTTEKNIV
jgi:hypothetical protein